MSSREAALLEQREALNEQLPIDASMMDIMWRDEGRCRCSLAAAAGFAAPAAAVLTIYR